MSGVAPLQGRMLPAGVTARRHAARHPPRAGPALHARSVASVARSCAGSLDPPQVKPDTPMPKHGAERGRGEEPSPRTSSRRPSAPQEARPIPARLPVLARKVTYDEVATRVLRKTCWHCHGEPDFERGDGGPGNSGGFGFKGRGLNLSDYAVDVRGLPRRHAAGARASSPRPATARRTSSPRCSPASTKRRARSRTIRGHAAGLARRRARGRAARRDVDRAGSASLSHGAPSAGRWQCQSRAHGTPSPRLVSRRPGVRQPVLVERLSARRRLDLRCRSVGADRWR